MALRVKIVSTIVALSALVFVASYDGFKSQRVSIADSQAPSCISDVPLDQHEIDAYASLSSDIGLDEFCASPIVKFLRDGDHTGACKQILLLNKVQGRIEDGVGSRRRDEYMTCIGQGIQG